MVFLSDAFKIKPTFTPSTVSQLSIVVIPIPNRYPIGTYPTLGSYKAEMVVRHAH